MSHNLDFLEKFRASLYPKLHSSLRSLGLYSVGKVGEDQYVCTLRVSEDEIEKELLHSGGFQRNVLAAYKEHPDGRESTLSLRLTHSGSEKEYDREFVEPGMQLHLTLLPAVSSNSDATLDVYAHYEDDWASSPLAHLRSKNFSAVEGRKRALALFDVTTFLSRGDDYVIEKRLE